ncbi:MAG: AzlC family ABC transporter permease, partial [Armatimonadetes bacterium]|nr:AzlC family ABC transporter permease [Armatimonadota bacterium]
MRSRTGSWLEGARDALPVAGVYAASGVALGVLARQASLGPAEVGAMSLLVYAGSTQFTAVGLLIAGAPHATIVATTLLLSLRSLTYGAALAPYLSTAGGWHRLLLAFGLTDEAFALAVRRFRARGADLAYMAGAVGTASPAWDHSPARAAAAGGAVPSPE